MKNLKTYTIDEIMNGDSSSDEEDGMNHFPWLKKGYQNIYDDLICDEAAAKNADYPKAQETDALIKLTSTDVLEKDLLVAP